MNGPGREHAGPDAAGGPGRTGGSAAPGDRKGQRGAADGVPRPGHATKGAGGAERHAVPPAGSGSASGGGPQGRPDAGAPGSPNRPPSRPAAPAGSSRPKAGSPRIAKGVTTASIIGWTGLSALVPGAAHLRAGRRRLGFTLLGIFGAVLVATVVFGVQVLNDTGIVARDSTLMIVSITLGVLAVTWFALVIVSYTALSPRRLTRGGQIISGVAVGMLCVTVMAPFALAANSLVTARNTINDIFQPNQGAEAHPVKAEDPWRGRDRVNFLMIGGDAAGNREGIRTDTMMVASVHVKTGNTVMFSLPRNLQYVRFPPGTQLAAKFPNGFNIGEGLLNEVWYHIELDPQITGAKGQGPKALKEAIGHTLGMKIDYYALVNMYGFAALVDAIGGLKIRVTQDVPWGGTFGTAGTIKVGYRTLNGEETLWYGRSRVGTDDFSRMERQRCVIGALAKQATPSVLLQNFNRIAGATKNMVRTDIPRDLLEHLVPLGMKVKDAKISSVQFKPPAIHPGNPDWHKIRTITARALRNSLRSERPATAAASPGASSTPSSTPSAGASATATGAGTGTAAARPTPLQTPTPNQTANANGQAEALENACGL
ncbi:cell envelope-related function transcriptional attenuator common domain-containing protein [Sinosporangium album]|uniref:Cell envelope-related function transcriptional attenuator common domain-containing protein n=1 Tax=Sinosporangium album TaxID=504805 RepID=A0A1G8DUI4_9ACTN|nr:LCP family protein [Sinosporangium album]SDH61352.1 cell envelope-related function transcriptional attenuator common domain-containing protein [Sinosporangium album]